VPSGLSEAKRQAAAEFLLWLSKPAQQARWHRNTGYFPVREEAITQLEADGFYEENPNFRTALDQLRATEDSPATRGALMGPFRKVRTVVEEGYVNTIQSDGVSVADGLSRIDADAEAALESYNQKV
jgi:sn-glycerol 3-phosphate transport system substrate-binding protein